MTGDDVIRVLVADDQPLVRGGIRLLLEQHADLLVVGEAEDGGQAVRRALELRPDVVVMDVRMPVLSGVEATRALVAQQDDPDHLVKVLVLTTFDDDEVVYGALRAGAHGFLIKHTAPVRLHDAVRTVASGDAWIDPKVTGHVLQALRSVPQPGGSGGQALAVLTPREREVLTVMAQGRSNAEIGRQLYLSEKTVKTHVARILMKTGSRDRTQAVVLAFRAGLVVVTPVSPP